MSSLVNEQTRFHLTPERLQTLLVEIKSKLQGRVEAAYIFGSASTGDFSKSSDIDLILVSSNAGHPFAERPLAYVDLYELYPKLDILVYTQAELDNQLADANVGFWKSVRLSLKRLV